MEGGLWVCWRFLGGGGGGDFTWSSRPVAELEVAESKTVCNQTHSCLQLLSLKKVPSSNPDAPLCAHFSTFARNLSLSSTSDYADLSFFFSSLSDSKLMGKTGLTLFLNSPTLNNSFSNELFFCVLLAASFIFNSPQSVSY